MFLCVYGSVHVKKMGRQHCSVCVCVLVRASLLSVCLHVHVYAFENEWLEESVPYQIKKEGCR